jgi:hypothetical protein
MITPPHGERWMADSYPITTTKLSEVIESARAQRRNRYIPSPPFHLVTHMLHKVAGILSATQHEQCIPVKGERTSDKHASRDDSLRHRRRAGRLGETEENPERHAILLGMQTAQNPLHFFVSRRCCLCRLSAPKSALHQSRGRSADARPRSWSKSKRKRQ